VQYLDHVLRVRDLGLPTPSVLETADGYMRWYFTISHPYITQQHEDVHILRSAEQEGLDEIFAEQHEDQQ